MHSALNQDEEHNRRAAQDRHAAVLCAAVVSYATGVGGETILAAGRGAQGSATARQLAMYLAHVGLSMSLARVAAAFGRDRSTVAYAVRCIEERRDDFEDWLDTLEAALTAAPPASASPKALRLGR